MIPRTHPERDVWLDPSAFEDLGHAFHTLFDDFCDADEPERFLDVSLRSDEEVVLTRELGAALDAAAAEAPDETHAEYLQVSSWPEVVAIAGRLAQVMVANDLQELAGLLDDTAVPDRAGNHEDRHRPLRGPTTLGTAPKPNAAPSTTTRVTAMTDGITRVFTWEEGTRIGVRTLGAEIVVAANAAGLKTLAAHLLTLAHDGTPDGAHLHLEEGNGL
ncbi:hypothetical protein [Streptomyces sp. SID2999]|uniref:SCO4402 family protein n=1 Tax=Streptomyces sp. SID2999 TaxID=2690258 RepID=UPI001F331B1C|nr:hypothetical protein [Streptomyces sp. SID2999]